MLFVYSRKKNNGKKVKKNFKKFYLPTYPIFFGACKPQCCIQTYFHTVESVLVTNM